QAPLASHPFTPHNLYGGRDGSVYRNNPSGSWERNTGPAWRRAPAAPRTELQPHAFGRAMGEQRFNNFHSFGGGYPQSPSALSHGGGGSRSSGGGHADGGGHR